MWSKIYHLVCALTIWSLRDKKCKLSYYNFINVNKFPYYNSQYEKNINILKRESCVFRKQNTVAISSFIKHVPIINERDDFILILIYLPLCPSDASRGDIKITGVRPFVGPSCRPSLCVLRTCNAFTK